jgi:integrase
MVRRLDELKSEKNDADLRNIKNRIFNLKGIPKVNTEAIFKFDERLQCGTNSRTTMMMAILSFFRHTPHKPIVEFDRDDFNPWLKHMDSLKPSTFNAYFNTVERLFQFVLNLDENEVPLCMKGIKRKRIDRRTREQILSENLLDKGQIMQLIQMTSNKKYQAIIMTGFDGALRKSEIMNIYINEDMEIFDDHIKLTVRDGKGGNTDPIILVDSVPYIKAWLSEHPFFDGDNTPSKIPLWPREKGPLSKIVEIEDSKETGVLPLRSWVIDWLLKMLAEKAGFKKKLWPHILRHSKISSMLNDEGYTLTEVQHHARHRSIASTMLYLHLKKNHNLKNKMLEKAGKLKIDKESNKNPFKIKLCARCSEENIPTNKFCLRCGWDFSKDLRQVKLENEKETLAKNFITFFTNNPDASKFLDSMMKTFLDQKNQSGNLPEGQVAER